MSWELKVSKTAWKQIKKFPKFDGEAIVFAIEALREDAFGGDVKKLKGKKNVWRKRVRNYRVFYEVCAKEGFISILEVKKRDSQTY